MKDEEGRQIATVKAFNVAEKRVKEMNTKLTEAEREKKNAEAAFEGAERQAKIQRKQLCQAENELVVAREQIKVLKKKLEDAEKAKDQAKQDGYDVGVAKNEKAFRAKVSGVCRVYCLQVWNEALNLAGVEASWALKRAQNVYYPPAIEASGSSASQDDVAPKGMSPIEEIPTKDLPPPSSPPKRAEQTNAPEKGKEVPKEVAPKMTKSSNAPKDSSKGGMVSQSHELVLATLPIHAKEEPKGKGLASSATATAQPAKAPKDKLIIKMKP